MRLLVALLLVEWGLLPRLVDALFDTPASPACRCELAALIRHGGGIPRAELSSTGTPPDEAGVTRAAKYSIDQESDRRHSLPITR
ncbi:MAG: hypothetical protein ACRDTF_07245 [Pseudonocardiaceae bacterium]